FEHVITQRVRVYRRSPSRTSVRPALRSPRPAAAADSRAPAWPRPVARRRTVPAPVVRIDRPRTPPARPPQGTRRERDTDRPPVIERADLLGRVKELADRGRYDEALAVLRSGQLVSAEAQ